MSDCCIAKAASEVGRIMVKGMSVGISNLNGIFEAVSGQEGEGLKESIIRHASIYNYIPKTSRDDYALGLLEAYEVWRSRK